MEPKVTGLIVGIVVATVGVLANFFVFHGFFRNFDLPLQQKFKMSLFIAATQVVSLLGIYLVLTLLFELPSWLESGMTIFFVFFAAPAIGYKRAMYGK